jgi:hypothetical protein
MALDVEVFAAAEFVPTRGNPQCASWHPRCKLTGTMGADDDPKSRSSITSPQIPSARRAAGSSSQSGARAASDGSSSAVSGSRRINGASFRPPPPELELRPTAVERACLDALVDDLEPMLSDTICAELRRHFEEGAYTAGLEILDRYRAEAPRNRSLHDLAAELRGVIRDVLQERLGPGSRKLLACDRQGVLTPNLQRIVDAAQEPRTLSEVVHAVGGDEIATRERIVRLLMRGWLLAGPMPAGRAKIERDVG